LVVPFLPLFLDKIMKIKSALILASIILTSCSNSDEEPVQSGDFNFTVAKDEDGAYPLADGEKAGLYIFEGQTKSLIIDNICLIHDNNGRLYSETVNSYPAFQSGMYIVAIAPYNADWTHPDNGVREFSVNTDQRTYNDFKASDLRHAVPVDNNPISSSNVMLAFSHLFSRIDIEVLDADSKYGLDTATLTFRNLVTCAMVEPYSGFIVDRPETIHFAVLPYESIHTPRRLVASIILPPQTIAAGSELISLSSTGKEISCGLPKITTLAGGETLSLQINLTASGMEVASSTIADWQDGEDIDITIQK
jgi:hypothetical protein